MNISEALKEEVQNTRLYLLHALSTIFDLLCDILDKLLLFLSLLVLQSECFVLQAGKHQRKCSTCVRMESYMECINSN